MKGKLDKCKGLDCAKLLDQIVEGYDKLGNESDEVPGWAKEIIALDPDNKAGLKVKYEFPLDPHRGPASSCSRARRDEAKDPARQGPGLEGRSRRNAAGRLPAEGRDPLLGKEVRRGRGHAKLAKEAAPESQDAKQIDSAIEKFSKVAEDQKASEKLEADLPKSEGTDLAKLLDKLVEAKLKLAQVDPDAGENINKWTREIITLDPDNKTGLKKKYQFKAALVDAVELMQADKVGQANTLIDKALETPGIAPEDMQAGQLMKAQIALQQHNEAEGVAHLKKALEAVPDGQLCPSHQAASRSLRPAEEGGQGEG